MSEVICLRCGCPIQPGETRKWRLRQCEENPKAQQGYQIDQHGTADDCMVALRRKEIEAARKDQP